MLTLARFLIVTLFSLAMGMLFGLGIARLTGVEVIQRPVTQIFILAIFLILAHQAGWLQSARQTWGSPARRQSWRVPAIRLLALCIVGLAMGVLMRAGIQGLALILLQFASPSTYASESRDLVHLWQSASQISATRVAQFALGATREEAMYRYVLIGAMMPIFGPLRAIVFSSLIFAVVHVNPVTFVYGLFFACAFLATRSLSSVAVMHTAANGWHSVVGSFGWVPATVRPEDILRSSYGSVLMGCAAILLVVVVTAMVAFIRSKSATDKNVQRNPA
jgi:membrane protease YdiL (CAAX protease family)